MTSGAPDYNLDPLFVYMLDQVIDSAKELKINLILDNHTFSVTESTSTNIDKILMPVWTHMAERYKDRSKYIYYEILNEPHGIADSSWNRIQMLTLSAIRKIDTVHTVIVGPASWNSYNNLSAMPLYTDTNLIYTFHFYDPFVFTHQGAGWVDPSMVPLSGVPFPYNPALMPDCPNTLKGTWIESSLNNYINDGTVSYVQKLIDIADNFQKTRHVKLYCGELGVFMENAPDSDRTYWYREVRKYMESKNIAWTTWDYKGGFGLFKKGSNELFDYDLNVPLLKALGFNVPEQQSYVLKPDSTGFNIYTDYIGENILGSGSAATDFWNETDPENGKFSIYWTGANQYNTISFVFKPVKDLSELVSEDYSINFYMKGIGKTPIDIRFIDAKMNDIEHPWRMRYTIDSTNFVYDGTWKHVQVSLKNFREHGAWDNNTWYNPEGKFDWRAIDRFEIDSEYGNMDSSELWFDDIKILNSNTPLFVNDNTNRNVSFRLLQNYPNPFNPVTKIRYNIAEKSFVTLKVYDILGKEVAVLASGEMNRGTYELNFNASNLSSGIYFYRLISEPDGGQKAGYQAVKKLMLIK
jgi:endoglucanase